MSKSDPILNKKRLKALRRKGLSSSMAEKVLGEVAARRDRNERDHRTSARLTQVRHRDT